MPEHYDTSNTLVRFQSSDELMAGIDGDLVGMTCGPSGRAFGSRRTAGGVTGKSGRGRGQRLGERRGQGRGGAGEDLVGVGLPERRGRGGAGGRVRGTLARYKVAGWGWELVAFSFLSPAPNVILWGGISL